jgi:hypothetical protein
MKSYLLCVCPIGGHVTPLDEILDDVSGRHSR